MPTPTNDEVKASRAKREENGEIPIRYTAPTWISATDNEGNTRTRDQIKAIRAEGLVALRSALNKYMKTDKRS